MKATKRMLHDNITKDDPPTLTSRLPTLKEHTKVLVQNQTGKIPLKWVKAGVVAEVMPFVQYIVKIHDSNRPTGRNRKFLRPYVPTLEEEKPIAPYEEGMY